MANRPLRTTSTQDADDHDPTNLANALSSLEPI